MPGGVGALGVRDLLVKRPVYTLQIGGPFIHELRIKFDV